MYQKSLFDKVKEEVSIVDTIGRYVRLKKSGSNFSGLCPFHNEKTPSFTVSPVKNFFHCFGCNTHGDVISFISKMKNINYKEAAVDLASSNAIDITEYNNNRISALDLEKNKIKQALEIARDFFKQCMHEQVFEYLYERNINHHLINTFEIGYARGDKSLIKYLKDKKISIEIMQKAGLIKKNDKEEIYEFFRKRVIFPIKNKQGKLIGFGSRSIDTTDKIKYLNSPETLTFNKSFALFGEEKASAEAYKKNRYIVVEGYIDVLSMHKVGIKETVASLGTAITLEQINKMFSQVNEIVLCMDGDNAGKKAAFNTVIKVLPFITADKQISVMNLPLGSDPDSLIQENSSAVIEDLIRNRITVSQYLFEQEISKFRDLSSPEVLAKIEQVLLDYCNIIKDATLKRYYYTFFKEKCRTLSSNKSQKNQYLQSKKINFAGVKKIFSKYHDKTSTPLYNIEKSILSMIVHNPEIMETEEIMENLLSVQFLNKNLANLFNYIAENGIMNFDQAGNMVQATLHSIQEFNKTIMYVEYSTKNIETLVLRHRLEILKREYASVKGQSEQCDKKRNLYIKEIIELQNHINTRTIDY